MADGLALDMMTSSLEQQKRSGRRSTVETQHVIFRLSKSNNEMEIDPADNDAEIAESDLAN